MTNHNRILKHAATDLLERESWEVPFRVPVRPSSLPFCQVQYLFSELDPIVVSGCDTFMEKIYVSIGTATHGVLQTYLGRAGLLYGKWKCKKCFWVSSPSLGTPWCGDTSKYTWTRGVGFTGEPIGPEEGPCGGCHAYRYEEFEMVDPVSGLRGSCDGLLMVAGHLYLLEIKTKPSAAVVNSIETPEATHVAQATTYAEMCTPAEWGLDEEIEGVAFCYVPRDRPGKMRFIFHDRDTTALDSVRKDVPAAKEMLESGRVKGAKAVCANEQVARKVKYCPYASQCFRPDRAKFMRRLWKRRQLEIQMAEENS